MILGQINIFGFNSNILARVDNDNVGVKNALVTLETDHLPAIELIVDDSTTATIQLLDEDDANIGSPVSMTVVDVTTYKRLIYLGTTLSGNSNGIYSLKITNGANTYYSDQFNWCDSVDDLLKITATSSNIKIGGTYEVDLTNFTFECYLSATYLGIDSETEEEASTKIGVANVLYANTSIIRPFSIRGNENTFKFLSVISRVIGSNGIVTVYHGYKTFTAKDILVEKTDNFIDSMVLNFKFTDINEVFSSSNNV
jgi:hypothetical protein